MTKNSTDEEDSDSIHPSSISITIPGKQLIKNMFRLYKVVHTYVMYFCGVNTNK